MDTSNVTSTYIFFNFYSKFTLSASSIYNSELRDLQEQQKKQDDQSHHENFVVNALATWNKEILPNWENMYVCIIDL